MPTLSLTPLKNIPLIRQGDDLADILVRAMTETQIELEDDDILVLTQKIVSKAEGQMVSLATVTPTDQAIDLAKKSQIDPRVVELMLRESSEILRVRVGTIVVEHHLGFICANAGIDHSNVGSTDDSVLLLPLDPDRSSRVIREQVEKLTGKKIGVMVIDSHGRAWRIGTVGMCIGLSGLPAVVDERGWKDLFGYTLRTTVVGVADELAAAASLTMGQAAEGRPAIHVRGFPYPLREGSLRELIRPRDGDMFR